MTRSRREDTHFYKWQGRISCVKWKKILATSVIDEAQSIVAAALAKMEEKVASTFQPTFAFAA